MAAGPCRSPLVQEPLAYRRVPGVRLEALGDAWVAFSPLSGETSWINDTAAAILEVMADHAGEAVPASAVAAALAADTGENHTTVTAALAPGWQALRLAALILPVHRRTPPADNPDPS
jgi:hypothetical protein